MSRSYHATHRDLKGKTKKELEEMTEDPDSELNELAEKGRVKREIVRKRRKKKQRRRNEL